MLKLICLVSILACVGVLQTGCAPTHNYMPPPAESLSPEIDDSVKIQFGRWKIGEHLSMGSGSVFMWYGNRIVSEEEFCELVAESYKPPSIRPALLIVMDRSMDMSCREF